MAEQVEVGYIEVQSTTHLYVGGFDFAPDTRRTVNGDDREIRDLIAAGLIIVVDEETAKRLPAPLKVESQADCGCGK